MQNHAAHQLHVEVALAQRALGRFPDGGERFRQDVLERFAVLQAFPERRP